MADKLVKRKVILIGDGAVGKTSLVRRFVTDKFDDRYITTIGTKVSKKEMKFQQDGDNISVTFMVWDILGQQGYTAVQRAGYRGCEGAILVCDYTRRETLESLETYWIPELQSVVGAIPMVVAGNKFDLTEKHAISENDIAALASKLNCPHISSSALTGQHVEEMFLDLAKVMVGGSVEEQKTDDQFVHAQVEESMDVVKATDWLMGDFCDKFGGVGDGMPVIRQQFEKAGVDVKAPTWNGLLQVVEQLAFVESGFKSPEEVNANKNRRHRIITSARG